MTAPSATFLSAETLLERIRRLVSNPHPRADQPIMPTTARIRELNDAFRNSLPDRRLGKLYMTAGVDALGPEFAARAVAAVKAFDAFTKDNDPHHEHDFGSFELDGEKLFFKID